MIFGIAVSPDGTRIAASGSDKRIWIWDAQSGELLNRFYGHTASVHIAVYTPDGKGLLTTGDDHVAFLWDLQTGKAVHMFERHWGSVSNLAISSDGRAAMTFDRGYHESGEVKLWDIDTGNLIRTFTSPNYFMGCALSPNGAMLATVSKNGDFQLWDVQTGEIVYHRAWRDDGRAYQNPVTIAFSQNGEQVAIGAKGIIRLVFWNRRFGNYDEIDFPETYSTQVMGLSFSPDGEMLAATFAGTGNQIYLWDIQSRNLLKRMSHPGAHLTSLAFSPDGKTILTGSTDGIPRLWDVETGTPQRVLCPNIISRRYSAAGWLGLFALIVVPLRAFRRFSGRDRLRAA